jgi:uncharacterized protein YlaI
MTDGPCQLCEVKFRKRGKKLKHYTNYTKRAGNKPFDLWLCGSCYFWFKGIMSSNHGDFVN